MNSSISGPALIFHHIAIFMMSFYLLADMFSGFTIIYLGVDIKFSLLYKIPLFALLLILLAKYNLKMATIIVCLILLFLVGPLITFIDKSILEYLVADFASIIKLVTPITVLFYLKALFNKSPEFADKCVHKILLCSFYILSFNFLLGALGLGKSTYKLEDEDSAGSTGFIMAGNELGAAFLITFGYMLHQMWNKKNKLHYCFISIFTVLCGFIVSTKTTMLASILLVFIIPLVNERDLFFKITTLKAKIFIPLFTLVAIISYLVLDILKSIGLYDRIMWFYEKKGIIGIILSGRDEMVIERMDTFVNNSSLIEQLFGQGQAIGLKEKFIKASTEIDSVDVLTYYGFIPLIFIVLFYLLTALKSFKYTLKHNSLMAPYVSAVSCILLLLSQLSGHIWLSGTVGILLGVMLSFNYMENPARNKVRN